MSKVPLSCSLRRRCRGLTLVELMVAMTLGLMVVGAATALLLSTKSAYLAQDDEALIQDSGRYAIEQIARAVRQAAYENWNALTAPVLLAPESTPNILGLDNARPKSTTAGIDPPLLAPVHGSDVLALRFFGSGDAGILNCAGFSVPVPVPGTNADDERGWSIFYVAKDGHGIPQLYCKYHGTNAWQAQSIVQGVESFQVLYGLDSDGDGLANRFVNAHAIDVLDDALVLSGDTPALRAVDLNRKTSWKKVVAIRLALLVRGSHPVRADAPNEIYDLFGSAYSDANADADTGVQIDESALPGAERNRLRKLFTTTIQLRNRSAGSMT